ncbi:MAG: hypothetical protein OXU75_22225 [Deltaproteobacteria bacterium]|nr:hypothetical protein [Deltaproteobacteria bacterium]
MPIRTRSQTGFLVILTIAFVAFSESGMAQNTCLRIESVATSGFGASAGYWVNQCSTGVHVKWNNFGTRHMCTDPAGCVGCEPAGDSLYPCKAFVPANGKTTATLWGVTNWHECQSDDPYAIVIREESYGLVKCMGD